MDSSNLVNAQGSIPTVDELLDTINLTFPNYVPSDDALHFWATMQLIKGKDFFAYGIPKLHYYFIDLAFNNITREMLPYSDEINKRVRLNKDKIAILCSRGLSKSTTFSAFLVIYMAMFGRLPGLNRRGTGDKVWFVIGLGDSQEGGAKVMCQTIASLIEESAMLQEYFEKIRTTDAEIELVRKDDPNNPLSIGKRSFKFLSKGAQAGVRGQRYKGERVDVIIADDMVKSESDSRSAVIMEAISSTIYSDAVNALRASGGKEILIGTPFNKNDVVYSAIEGGWTPLVVPICNKAGLDMQECEFVGSWPEMHTFDRIKSRYRAMYEAGKVRAFNQELMLRIASEEDKLIKDDHIQWFNRRSMEKTLGEYNLVMTTDLTASNGLLGDYSGIALWAVNHVGDWFMLDLALRPMGIEEQYIPIFNMVQRYSALSGRTIEVGIELDGQQRLNLVALKKTMREKNIYFRFAKQVGKPWGSEGVTRSGNGKKHDHFMRFHPMMQSHKIFFAEELKDSPDMKELLSELSYVTYTGITSKRDDGLDLLSMIPLIDVVLPMKPTGKPMKDMGNGIMVEMRGRHNDEPNAFDGY